MRKYRLMVAMFFTLVVGALPALADFPYPLVFDDREVWELAVCWNYEEENFADAILNPGLSVTTDIGGVVAGEWYDSLHCPGYDVTTTTWHFEQPIFGFGGAWDTLDPGGPGAGIEVSINGLWFPIGEIPNTYAGDFWGFVIPIPFTEVRLSYGSNCDIAWTETYTLDDMVYNEMQNYATGGGKLGEKKATWTFGGNVGFAPWGDPVGQFQINDHENKVSYHTVDITNLIFLGPDATTPYASHNSAMFRAEFRGNDGSMTTMMVRIWDRNESREKLDAIVIMDQYGNNIVGPTLIDGGNFQMHDGEFEFLCGMFPVE